MEPIAYVFELLNLQVGAPCALRYFLKTRCVLHLHAFVAFLFRPTHAHMHTHARAHSLFSLPCWRLQRSVPCVNLSRILQSTPHPPSLAPRGSGRFPRHGRACRNDAHCARGLSLPAVSEPANTQQYVVIEPPQRCVSFSSSLTCLAHFLHLSCLHSLRLLCLYTFLHPLHCF